MGLNLYTVSPKSESTKQAIIKLTRNFFGYIILTIELERLDDVERVTQHLTRNQELLRN